MRFFTPAFLLLFGLFLSNTACAQNTINKGIGHYTYSSFKGQTCIAYRVNTAFQANQYLVFCQNTNPSPNFSNDLQKALISNDYYRYTYYQKQSMAARPIPSANNPDFKNYPAFKGDSWGEKALNNIICPILVVGFEGIAKYPR